MAFPFSTILFPISAGTVTIGLVGQSGSHPPKLIWDHLLPALYSVLGHPMDSSNIAAAAALKGWPNQTFKPIQWGAPIEQFGKIFSLL